MSSTIQIYYPTRKRADETERKSTKAHDLDVITFTSSGYLRKSFIIAVAVVATVILVIVLWVCVCVWVCFILKTSLSVVSSHFHFVFNLSNLPSPSTPVSLHIFFNITLYLLYTVFHVRYQQYGHFSSKIFFIIAIIACFCCWHHRYQITMEKKNERKKRNIQINQNKSQLHCCQWVVDTVHQMILLPLYTDAHRVTEYMRLTNIFHVMKNVIIINHESKWTTKQ